MQQLSNVGEQLASTVTALEPQLASEPATEPGKTTPDLMTLVTRAAAQMRQDVTALSLSVSPAKASTITTLTNKILAAQQELVGCSRLLGGASPYDSTTPPLRSLITAVWAERVSALGRELSRYMEALVKKIQSGNDAYLSQTGLVWEAIDALAELPRTEADALVQRWKRDGGLVKDAWEEFKESLEDDGEEEENPFGDEGFGDDDFAELEATLGGSMTPEERRRAEAVSWTPRLVTDKQSKPLLGLHQILHATVPRYIPLGTITKALPSSTILGAGSDFVNAFDEAVGALSTGQDVADIKEAMGDLGATARKVCDEITERIRAEPENEDRKKALDSLRKWTEKLDETTKAWEESAFGMSEMMDAL